MRVAANTTASHQFSHRSGPFSAVRRWLDRLVPLMDGELSALDVFDGGRVAVVAPVRVEVAA